MLRNCCFRVRVYFESRKRPFFVPPTSGRASDLLDWHFDQHFTIKTSAAKMQLQMFHASEPKRQIRTCGASNTLTEKCSGTRSALHSNVKKLFEQKKRPLNLKAISQPAGSSFFTAFTELKKGVCMCVCVLATGWRTVGLQWFAVQNGQSSNSRDKKTKIRKSPSRAVGCFHFSELTVTFPAPNELPGDTRLLKAWWLMFSFPVFPKL